MRPAVAIADAPFLNLESFLKQSHHHTPSPHVKGENDLVVET
jgi:hypothetical protein